MVNTRAWEVPEVGGGENGRMTDEHVGQLGRRVRGSKQTSCVGTKHHLGETLHVSSDKYPSHGDEHRSASSKYYTTYNIEYGLSRFSFGCHM